MSPIRKEKLSNNQVYHIYSRSIAKFKVFNTPGEYARFVGLMDLFRYENFKHKFSQYNSLSDKLKLEIKSNLENDNQKLVNIVCYCLMPTHFHLVLEQKMDSGIMSYTRRLLNGYSKYFNVKHKRSGPLWSSRFKNVLVKDDEQLLHLTRYIHLNPTSTGLVNEPEGWQFSSYNEYINDRKHICNYKDRVDINPKQYKKFVSDRKNYQKGISLIKSILIDGYTG